MNGDDGDGFGESVRVKGNGVGVGEVWGDGGRRINVIGVFGNVMNVWVKMMVKW